VLTSSVIEPPFSLQASTSSVPGPNKKSKNMSLYLQCGHVQAIEDGLRCQQNPKGQIQLFRTLSRALKCTRFSATNNVPVASDELCRPQSRRRRCAAHTKGCAAACRFDASHRGLRPRPYLSPKPSTTTIRRTKVWC
jgi:hypothetical protein